ncbi:MAG: hypothetical protein ACHQJ6_00520 [Candidatus Berkiellales bacterium]
MFVQPITTGSFHQGHEALAACMTLALIGFLIYAFSQSKPTTQRVLLRLMFQPVLATTLFFTLWLVGILFSLFLAFTH